MSEALLDLLRQRGDLTGQLDSPPEDDVSVWVLAMQAVGGWLAALFLLLFLGLGTVPLVKSGTGWLAVGLILTAAAALALRTRRGALAQQFLLVLSLAGQGAVLFGLMDWHRGYEGTSWLAFAIYEAALFATIPWKAHRLICAYAALMALAASMSGALFERWNAGALMPLISVYWLVGGALYLTEERWQGQRTSPAIGVLAAALALVTLQFACTTLFRPFSLSQTYTGVTQAGLLALVSGVLMLATGSRVWRGPRAVLAGACLAALLAATWQAPGVGTGLAAMMIGFLGGRRWLLWLGGALAVVAIGRFYYDLQLTLLAKSAWLASGGIAMLALRWILAGARTYDAEEEA